jgi:D-alanyl-D-alanine carboxypeptidase
MTVLTATEALSPDFPVIITPESLYTEGESGLIPFEEWKFSDLAAFTLIVSSNDGAVAIAKAAEPYFERTENISFVEKMNKKAKHLSMENSLFYNPTGLDETFTRAGAYSNAQDVTRMLDYILRLHPKLVDDTQTERRVFYSSTGFAHSAENTNIEIGHIPGLIASKTGFTDLAGGNLVIAAELPDSRIIIVTAIGSTKEGRFTDVLSLYNATVKYYETKEKVEELEKTIEEVFAD